jgi:hypothetical protein
MTAREPAAGQATIEGPAARAAASAPAPESSPPPGGRSRTASFALVATGVCLVLAAVSVVVLPSVPSFDPWAWITWGREVFDSHINFVINGGPSWKPFPVVFTTVFGLFGGAAPKLWILVARAGGLLALVGAYRLGSRVAGRVAGAFAVVALALTVDWMRYLERGASEPLLVGLVLWAILAHLDAHRRTAFILGVAAGLVRPEVWPFVGLYAVWLWRTEAPRVRWLLIGGLVLLPVAWVVPPWIASNDPLSASTHAATYNGHLGSDPALEVLRRGAELTVVPVLLLALAALVLGARRRERFTSWLGGAAIAWVVLVLVMTLAGYPGLGRFMLPAAGSVCVLAGVGLVRLAGLAGGGARSLVVGAVLVVGAGVALAGRVGDLGPQYREVQHAEDNFSALDVAIKRAGGSTTVVRCGRRLVAVNHSSQTALAWKLGVELRVVRPFLRHPGIVFRGPHVATVGAPPDLTFRPRRIYEITRAGPWHVFGVLPPGQRPPPGCPHA